MEKVIVTAALTGSGSAKADNPALPISPEEIADDAVAAWEAGAAVVHLHFRDEHGQPSADLGVASRTINLIHSRCPVLIQVSTGVGANVSYEDRTALLDLRPPMASLSVNTMNFGSGVFSNPPDGVRKMAARMRELNIKPEVELYDTGHLDLAIALREEGFFSDPLMFSLVIGVRGGMPVDAGLLVDMVKRLPKGAFCQVVAQGPRNLEMSTIGLALGLDVRVGLEDSPTLPDGRRPRNTDLVKEIVALIAALRKKTATVEEAKTMLQIHG